MEEEKTDFGASLSSPKSLVGHVVLVNDSLGVVRKVEDEDSQKVLIEIKGNTSEEGLSLIDISLISRVISPSELLDKVALLYNVIKINGYDVRKLYESESAESLIDTKQLLRDNEFLNEQLEQMKRDNIRLSQLNSQLSRERDAGVLTPIPTASGITTIPTLTPIKDAAQLKQLMPRQVSFQSDMSQEEESYLSEDEDGNAELDMIKRRLIDNTKHIIIQSAVYSVSGTKDGKTKVNQDSYFIFDQFGPDNILQFYGVADGHGPTGHNVSQYVVKRLPNLLLSNIYLLLNDPILALKKAFARLSYELIKDKHKPIDEAGKAIEDDLDDGLFTPQPRHGHDSDDETPRPKDVVVAAALPLAVDKEEKKKGAEEDEEESIDFDTEFSGTTVSCALRMGDKIYLANLGDSRVVLGQKTSQMESKKKKVKAKQLTNDHELEDEKEQERLVKSGAIITYDDDGYPRIKIKQSKEDGTAGVEVTANLARSLGDAFASQYGVISVPDITTHQITDNDLFLILASDGVWQMFENHEAISAVGKSLYNAKDEKQMDLKRVVKKLVNEANAIWKDECFGYTDDITAIITRFGVDKPPPSTDDQDDDDDDEDNDDDT